MPYKMDSESFEYVLNQEEVENVCEGSSFYLQIVNRILNPSIRDSCTCLSTVNFHSNDDKWTKQDPSDTNYDSKIKIFNKSLVISQPGTEDQGWHCDGPHRNMIYTSIKPSHMTKNEEKDKKTDEVVDSSSSIDSSTETVSKVEPEPVSKTPTIHPCHALNSFIPLINVTTAHGPTRFRPQSVPYTIEGDGVALLMKLALAVTKHGKKMKTVDPLLSMGDVLLVSFFLFS